MTNSNKEKILSYLYEIWGDDPEVDSLLPKYDRIIDRFQYRSTKPAPLSRADLAMAKRAEFDRSITAESTTR